MMIFAKVWHFWMGVAIAGPAVLMVLATAALYLRKVVIPSRPRR